MASRFFKSVVICPKFSLQNTRPLYNITHNRTYATNNKDEEVYWIDVPRKGRVSVPKKIKELGDTFMKLDMIESVVFSYYVRDKLGLDKDVPDPFTALLESSQFAFLTGFPGPNMSGMMMNPGMMMGAGMAPQQGTAAAAPQAPKEEVKAEAPKEAEKPKEKTAYNLKLEKFDPEKKIGLIKELRKLDKNLSIKDAKDLVEAAPSILKKDVPKEEAEKLKKEFEAAGGVIVLE